MTERIDEAESAGKKAQLLPASAPVRPLGSSPENLMGACYQTSPEGSARPNCLRELRESKLDWPESWWPDGEGG